MFNIYEYSTINWEATSDNIKSLLNIHGIAKSVFAKAMCVSEKTVHNWCNGKVDGNPKLQELIIMALFFDVDIMDIVIINGRINKKINSQDINEMIELIDGREEKYIEKNGEYQFEEDIIIEFMQKEKLRSRQKINNLDEFMLYLPLFRPKDLAEFVYRSNGILATNREYVKIQLNKLYEGIEPQDAKDYADCVKLFCLTYPQIDNIDYKNKFDMKEIKYQEFKKIQESPEWLVKFYAYEKAVDNWTKKIKELDTIEIQNSALIERLLSEVSGRSITEN